MLHSVAAAARHVFQPSAVTARRDRMSTGGVVGAQMGTVTALDIRQMYYALRVVLHLYGMQMGHIYTEE